MKVIIQDISSQRFLSVSGQWVASRTEATDFHSLLRAYHHARQNTSRHFQVLLYSPDDNYSARIVDGMGVASPSAEAPVETPVAANFEPVITPRGKFLFPVCFLRAISHLN